MSNLRVLISGANGHIGRRLVARLAAEHPVTALVRSSAARHQLEQQLAGAAVDIVEVNYADADALCAAAHGCGAAVHLVGILKESATSRYVDAHERSTEALLVAARRHRLERIVYLSILGAHPLAPNACLASKGRAEQLLLRSGVPTLVLRVPMVLGEDDYASRSLRRRAHARLTVLIRGASLEQPIYAGDVVAAIAAGLACRDPLTTALDLAGPESLARSELVRRAAARSGRSGPVCVSLPLAPVLGAAGILEWCARRLRRDAPVTRAMLEVLDHDDRIDAAAAVALLGIRLTGLDEMLGRCVGNVR
jgi:uncharacterized protein YbjT (DUF2867 family)